MQLYIVRNLSNLNLQTSLPLQKQILGCKNSNNR